ncbi:MAG TPA: hypothetical protein VGM37_12170 [Armatimonadota bacterium]|jgi:hypothetical protein
MTMDITAGQVFPSGHRAPRGIYQSVQTGVLHRHPRAIALPDGGPFQLVASTDLLVKEQPEPMFNWPEESAPAAEDSGPWFSMYALYRITRSGWPF